jgi:hypothetical protein
MYRSALAFPIPPPRLQLSASSGANVKLAEGATD